MPNKLSPLSRAIAIALGAAAVTLVFAACDDSEEDIETTNPDIRGEVTNLTEGTGETLGTILIEGEIEADTSYDKASVRIDEDTRIYELLDGEPVSASFDEIRVGFTVEAWFEGPVAESYPVQAYARQVLILDPSSLSGARSLPTSR